MNSLDIKQLLPELKKLVTFLAGDLLKRVNTNAEINNGLKEAFHQIEKGGRTAQAYEVWLEDYLDQVAVAWVLACVFVRFMEDNGLIDDCWLAGEGERRKLAEDAQTLYFREHPHDSDREYFQHVFHAVGKIPAAMDLFAEGKTPLWAVAPSGDAAMTLLKFWREMNPETGTLKRPFQVANDDTRFLGDLYQELSERAKKKYALLQTPVFVEEFILDRTLTPAIAEFGLEKVRMIDPTCGSGHFLLGGFARLFRLWSRPEHTTRNAEKDAQKALDGVWGVDINPFAVAIARFRLIVAAVQACGIKRLKQAPGWTIRLATGDSLLFGSKPGIDGKRVRIDQQLNLFEVPTVYAVEDRTTLHQILNQGYHVVVGNPPYITVKDKVLNNAYRRLYSTCHRKYSLGVPFTQRFWELSAEAGEVNGSGGYIGMITTRSFMKREFGKKLIEDYLPKVDLTHILDTSWAIIPGHSTPTVILFGRNRPPVSDTVRAVLGIKGELSSPEDASKGAVWCSIVKHVDIVGAKDEYTSTADVPRSTFAKHPWSIGGGGASELKEQIDESTPHTLSEFVETIGFGAILGEEDAFSFPAVYRCHVRVPDTYVRPLIEGEQVRDWSLSWSSMTLFPYDVEIKVTNEKCLLDQLWPCRTILENRADFSKRTYAQVGRPFWEFHQIPTDRYSTPLSISFASVATHNHFVLDRGTKVFKQSAPIIKLPRESSDADYFGLLGMLNSSLACFWMKQVFYPKATAVGDISTDKGRPEANRYDIAGTGLLSFPVPSQESIESSQVVAIAKSIDDLAIRSSAILPERLLSSWKFIESRQTLSEAFAESKSHYEHMRKRMVALQEELDWDVYKVYGLTDEGAENEILTDTLTGVGAEHRPFLWLSDAVPPELSDSMARIYEKRRHLLNGNPNLKLIETLVFKRPWWGRQGVYGRASRTYNEWIVDACQMWLLKRLETPKYHKGTKDNPELTTAAQIADVASADAEFLQVAALYRGRPDFDVAELVAELVESEAVPFLPILRYKPAGLRKREVWERTWDLQRQQDGGTDVGDIPVPPKYTTADFLKTDFWRLRGKLDVPKERWISYPHCSTDSDPTLVVGWAGWNHLEQATALVAYYDARKREGWNPDRLKPLLAGLDQLIPWLHQWHPEVDPDYGETAGQSFQKMLESDVQELGLTLHDVRNWTPPVKQTKASKKKAKV